MPLRPLDTLRSLWGVEIRFHHVHDLRGRNSRYIAREKLAARNRLIYRELGKLMSVRTKHPHKLSILQQSDFCFRGAHPDLRSALGIAGVSGDESGDLQRRMVAL